jgi:serine/threonine-protein kinase RsbW
MEVKIMLSLPQDAASVPVGRQVLDGCLDTLGVLADTRADIALALTEACANVVRHAEPSDAYEVTASTRHGRCVIEVLNSGVAAAGVAAAALAPPSQPVPPAAEGGRGLKIMDAVVDDLRLTGDRRLGTTILHFEKDLRWAPGTAAEQLFSAEG